MDLKYAVSLLDALKDHPEGATPDQIARAVNRQVGTTSARLGKLAMYGVIDRTPIPAPPGMGRIAYRYHAKRFEGAHV